MQKLPIVNLSWNEWQRLLAKCRESPVPPLGSYDRIDGKFYPGGEIARGADSDRKYSDTGYLRQGSKIVGSVNGLRRA